MRTVIIGDLGPAARPRAENFRVSYCTEVRLPFDRLEDLEVFATGGGHSATRPRRNTLNAGSAAGDPWHTDGDLYVGVIAEGVP